MRTAIAVDTRSTTPLHRQIYDAWRQGILAGRLRRGERLPSTRELAGTLGVARSTVSQAYDQLLAEGYLVSAHGAGTFVCRELPEDATPEAPRASETRRTRSLRLSRLGVRLTRDFQPPPRPEGFICFSRWGADITQFPMDLWRRLLSRAMRNSPVALFDYAMEPQGLAPLRQEIAAYVGRARAVHCTADQVVVVNGSQQALELCTRLLFEPGDEVAFENPGYLGTRLIFESHGLKLRPARIDDEGIVPRDFGRRTRGAYITPSHQFPTGVAMSLARRLELIAWARKHDGVLIEDDYDSEYRYSGAPLPALQGLAHDVPVIYCGTFSKVMFPDLRIGYVIVPPEFVRPLTRLKWLTDRNTPFVPQAALADFLREGHLERHIRRMRRSYGTRRTTLVDALARHFGDAVAIRGEAAGMHLLARFGERGVEERARRGRVQIVSTRPYYLTTPQADEYLLGFSSLTERTIAEGIRRLARRE